MLSEHPVEPLGTTEAEVARDIFVRVSAGSSASAEAARLRALGVPCQRRYRDVRGGAKTIVVGEGVWRPSRLLWMLRNPVYIGRRVVNVKRDAAEIAAPALIDEDTFRLVDQRLRINRQLSKKNAKRTYLLRGLVTCDKEHGGCGFTCLGCIGYRPGYREYRYYKCQSRSQPGRADAERCRAAGVNADQLEALVWADCAYWLRHPDEGLAEAQAQLRARLGESARLEGDRRRLNELLAGKDEERERVMTLYRRKRMTLDEAERELEAIGREAADLRAMLDAIRAQDDLSRAYEAQYTEAATMLAELDAEVDEIEATNNLAKKRRVVELRVAAVRVKPQGRGIDGRVSVTYRFGRPIALAYEPVISRTLSKKPRLRSVLMAQFTGTFWYPSR